MRTVTVDSADLADLAAQLDELAAHRLTTGADRARRLLAGRRVWNVSATTGGGVGELISTLVPYARAAGVDARWGVLDGDRDFAAIAARLHQTMHGDPGDGGELGPAEMARYDRVAAANLAELAESVDPGDVVILHDPATAGLAPGLARRGAVVIWRCHLGTDTPNEHVDRAWAFLEPALEGADRVVLSRAAYRPGFLDPATVRIIPPSVDPLSPKNRTLAPGRVAELLQGAGLLAPAPAEPGAMRAGGPVPADARMVLQVSRWDRLKDPSGLIIAFEEGVEDLPQDVHLVLAGEDAQEGEPGFDVLDDCLQMWAGLEARDRVHIACLPHDRTANALLVNALQRRADVVVQKSLSEGFGLTVAEALWKGRPVVATAVGGIRDQIADGENGLLVPDPTDLQVLMSHVGRLLAEPAFAAQLGAAAHERVRREFLSDRHLLDYLDLLAELV
ncbi:MAG: glycosyltransferase [Georgenia sp.]